MRHALWLAGALLALAAHAAEPRKLQWEDLAVRLSAADNPFAQLSMDSLAALSRVAATRDRQARGEPVNAQQLADERAASRQLGDAGVDVAALLAQRDAVAERKRRAARSVNVALDGQTVRIPGYVLPLEFAGTKVTEFLLVPWFGACIHTPPPDANQIVHVKLDKPAEIERAFASVWVTGRMAARPLKKSVYVGDGASDIDIGYALQASQVEAYRQP